jgi:RNA polymerase sigma-70 factor (ECF subfamily)
MADNDRYTFREGTTSTGLIRQVSCQDEDAWRRLTLIYGRLVLHWCSQADLQPADRADVFQDVFAAVARHIDSFQHDRARGSFRGWLRTIVRSKIADIYRSRSREPVGAGGTGSLRRLHDVADALEESPDTVESEIPLVVREALSLIEAEFEPRTWNAFWRAAADGIAVAAVAQELGMTPAAVRKAKSRVLRRLRQEMGECGTTI